MDGRRDWWVLVGGRSRVGRALAEALAPSRNLVLTSSRGWEGEEPWLEGLSTEVRAWRWDARDPGFGSTMMADLDSLGAEGLEPGAAVIVAGVFPAQPLGTWTAEALDALWSVNLTFPLMAAQALAPRIRAGGTLQFLLDAAIHRPFPSRLPYSASKAALAAMVPGLARALAPRVRVAGHALGTVLPDAASDAAALARATPLGRTGSVAELALALDFVAESPTLTGAVLTLDGGWSL